MFSNCPSQETLPFVFTLTISAMGRRGDEMKIIGIFTVVCFLAMGALAQGKGTVSGLVMINDQPMSGATVTLKSKNNEVRTVTADSSGKYVFENVAPGEYEITGLLGTSNTTRVITVAANQSLTIDLDLKLDGRRIGTPMIKEFVTVAADANQTIDQVSKTIDVISGQEMRDRADFTLTDTLRTIPGFRVQQLGGFGRTSTIKTRGLRNQDTALLLDGIRFRDATAITGDASPFLSDFTLTSVSRVQVLRGSGSSLYGTNAIGGVVDFETPRPQGGWHGQLSGAAGGLGLARFRGNTSYGTGNGKYGFNLGLARTNYFEGIDSDDDANNTNFQTRVELNPSQKTNISLRGFVSDAFVKLNSNPDTIGPLPASNATIINALPLSIAELNRYAAGTPTASLIRGSANFIPDTDDPDAIQRSKFFVGQAVITQLITDKVFFQGYFQGLYTKRKNVNGPRGVGFQPFGGEETSGFDGHIYTTNGHINWRPNLANEITFGYENEWEKFGNEGAGPGGTGSFALTARQASDTVYAQDLVHLLKGRLQIAGGLRAQFFKLKKTQAIGAGSPYANLSLDDPPSSYTFDGSFSYLFKTGTKIRAHVGNGYRVPSLYERFGSFFDSFSVPNSFVALGDPGLKPERSIAFDGGIEQTLVKNRARLSATYFYTKLIDTIGYGNVVPNIGTTPRPFGGYLNTKGGISRGAEFSGTFLPTRSTDIFASYTFTNSDQLVPQVTGSRITRTLGVPANQFTLVATQRFGRFWVNFDLVATSDYLAPIFSNTTFGTYVYRFSGNRRGDVTAGYTFPLRKDKLKLRLFGTVENVFGYDYFENGFRTIGRTGRVGLSFGF